MGTVYRSKNIKSLEKLNLPQDNMSALKGHSGGGGSKQGHSRSFRSSSMKKTMSCMNRKGSNSKSKGNSLWSTHMLSTPGYQQDS